MCKPADPTSRNALEILTLGIEQVKVVSLLLDARLRGFAVRFLALVRDFRRPAVLQNALHISRVRLFCSDKRTHMNVLQ